MVPKKHSASAFAFASLAVAKRFDVDVGKDGLKFTPDEIKAEVGDEVVFHFDNDRHDVSQGPFNKPCQPYFEDGIWSGTINTQGTTGVTFTVPIQDTNTKWLYCSVGKHCQSGMTAVINPPKDGNTLEDYRNAAKDVDKSKSPTAIYGGSLNIGGFDGDGWFSFPPDPEGTSNSPSSHSSHSTEPTKTETGAGVETETETGTGTEAGVGTETATSGSTFTAKENMVISAILGLIVVSSSWLGLA